jgi:enoyl-CoA hydratase
MDSNPLFQSKRYTGGYLRIGNWESVSKKIGAKEIETFAFLSEDMNPLHLDAAFAATTMYDSS